MTRENLKEIAIKIEKRIKILAQARRDYINISKEVSKYICPERGRYPNFANKMDSYNNINSKANKYLHNLASILQSGLTSPARPWFKLSLQNKRVYEWGAVRTYLADIEEIISRVFRVSNFYPSIYSAYLELAAFGTTVMSTMEDESGVPIFTTYTVGQYLISQNDSGEIDTIYRTQVMSVENIIKKFKDCGYKTIEQLEKYDGDQELKVIHAVEKRTEYDSKKIDKFNMPYSSIWILDNFIDTDDFGILNISGFNEMPYHVARWDAINDDPYGIGPGVKAVGDVKNLNLLDKITTYGLNKAVNPPILVPSFMNIKLNNAPGGITYYSGRHDEFQIKPLYTISSDLNAAIVFMNRWEQILKETFQNDLFIYMMNRSNVTATEISERAEEKLLLLGPVLERIETELLIPCFDRVFNILERNNLLPDAPIELMGMDIKPEFIGLLANAQKSATLSSIKNLFSFVSYAAKADPEAIDKLDIDQAIDIYSSIEAIPNGLIRSDEETGKIREKRYSNMVQSNQNSNNINNIKDVIESASKLSKIDLNKNSALKEIIEANI